MLGQLKRILGISDSDAGVKEEKLEASDGGEGECGDEVEVLLVREIRSLDKNFVSEEVSKAVSKGNAWGIEVGNGDEDLRLTLNRYTATVPLRWDGA